MRKYIIRRVLLFIPTLIGVSIAIFVILRVIPGDIASIILGGPSGEGAYSLEELEALREQLGLNRPIVVQYFDWAWSMLRGDLGDSYLLSRPISDELRRQLPVTLQLAFFTALVVSAIAIPIGILAAIQTRLLVRRRPPRLGHTGVGCAHLLRRYSVHTGSLAVLQVASAGGFHQHVG